MPPSIIKSLSAHLKRQWFKRVRQVYMAADRKLLFRSREPQRKLLPTPLFARKMCCFACARMYSRRGVSKGRNFWAHFPPLHLRVWIHSPAAFQPSARSQKHCTNRDNDRARSLPSVQVRSPCKLTRSCIRGRIANESPTNSDPVLAI